MTRPYVFCHMMTSLDGKIMGTYMRSPEAAASGKVFYDLAFGDSPHYRHQGWLSGRVTTDDNFTHYASPALDEGAAEVPAGDFLPVRDAEKYYISIDPAGTLGWESPDLTYQTTDAHVLEVLTDRASNAYRAFLRKLGISYIIAGVEHIDFALLLDKLHAELGIGTLMLGGGGVLNWSFIQEGLCDELSLVIAPVADGATAAPALFSTGGFSGDIPRGFRLSAAEVRENDTVWLRYTVNNEQSGDHDD